MASRTEVPQFKLYVALGDSISIDLYPALDIEARRAMPAPEGLGAASLLYRNQDWLWPEFAGLDLATLAPGVEFLNLTADGAMTPDVLAVQLPSLPPSTGEPTLVTLTVGGNDLLQLLGAEREHGEAELQRIIANLREILRRIQGHVEQGTVLVGTVYDPSDGSADLGDAVLRPQEMEWLSTYNEGLKRITAEEGCVVADIHSHFLGHGRSVADPKERWFWEGLIIEPSARGASEVRRLWLRCLGIDSG